MPMVTYATAPTSKVYEGRGITLRKFLTYAVGDAQTTLPDGYFPLSSAMVQQTTDAISKIPTSTAPAPGSGGGTRTRRATRQAAARRLRAATTRAAASVRPRTATSAAPAGRRIRRRWQLERPCRPAARRHIRARLVAARAARCRRAEPGRPPRRARPARRLGRQAEPAGPARQRPVSGSPSRGSGNEHRRPPTDRRRSRLPADRHGPRRARGPDGEDHGARGTPTTTCCSPASRSRWSAWRGRRRRRSPTPRSGRSWRSRRRASAP